MTVLPRLAVTVGEPAGIGPELLIRLVHSRIDADLVAIGDQSLLLDAAARLGLSVQDETFDPGKRVAERAPGSYRIVHQPLPLAAMPGRLEPGNAPAVVATLAAAAYGCRQGWFDAVLTLPVHKGVINDAGIPFSGHTEFFADRAGCDVLMLLVANTLRVALATTHLPLRDVPDAITPDGIRKGLQLLVTGLRGDFGIAAPRIAVLGLNPHAGENGHLGREEIDVIAPGLSALRAKGMSLDGPLSADTAFTPGKREHYDAYFAMYHDQGLTALKALDFGTAVNVTLGLPFVRTSVDHGVALDLAGTNRADAGSALAAAELALAIARRRRHAST